jgi:hypothetical protein
MKLAFENFYQSLEFVCILLVDGSVGAVKSCWQHTVVNG